MLTCQTCGHEFQQNWDGSKRPPQTEKGEERKTMLAAKANKQGPFCELCRHLEMALRYAQTRNLLVCAFHITTAQQNVKKL